MLYYFAGFNGYLLLGHYVKENKDGNILKIFWPFSGNGESDRHNSNWSVWKTFLICAVMFAVGYYVTYTGFSTTAANPNATETEMELYFTFCSPNVLLMTLAAFLLMKKVVVNTPVVVKALANMTKCGFGIYMVHYFCGRSVLPADRSFGNSYSIAGSLDGCLHFPLQLGIHGSSI